MSQPALRFFALLSVKKVKGNQKEKEWSIANTRHKRPQTTSDRTIDIIDISYLYYEHNYSTLSKSALHVQLKQPPSNAPRPSPGLDAPRRVVVLGCLPQRLEVHEQAQRRDGAHDSRDEAEDGAGGPRLVDPVVAAVEGGVLEGDEPGAPCFCSSSYSEHRRTVMGSIIVSMQLPLEACVASAPRRTW